MHYRKHIFCCVNERVADHHRSCCGARGSTRLRTYMKKRAKDLGLKDIRVNSAGCLERCELGPAMVIYPEGVWYHYETFEDVNEILDRHILNGEVVDRLMLEDGQVLPEKPQLSRLQLRVNSIEYSASNILKVELLHEDNRNLPEFTAGAHIDLIIDEIGGRRSYSLINHPRERHRYVIAVSLKRRGQGGSQWLHDHLRAGELVQSSYPINTFELVESARSHRLIAGGIGITPFIGMSYRLRELNANFHVHYCTKSVTNIAFVKELEKASGGRVSYHNNNESDIQSLIEKSQLSDNSKGEQLYISGSENFIAGVMAAAVDWPESNIHTEWFNRRESDFNRNEPFDVVLARRKTTLRVGANESILDALRNANILNEFACEGGLCGACRIRVLYGKVEHRDIVLNEREKAAEKLMMICVSRAAAGENKLILEI